MDFITSLTTPYGTTTFNFTDTYDSNYPVLDPNVSATHCNCPQGDTAPNGCSCRSVTVTDTLGRTSYVEFLHGAPGIGDPGTITRDGGMDSSSAPLSTLMSIANNNLIYRNTFAWDPYQFEQAGGMTALANNSLDYTKAHLTHWLHSAAAGVPSSPSSTSRVIESTKEPLESRVWYDYADNQNPPNVFGTSNEISQKGRVLPDGTPQVWTFGYTPVDAQNPVPIEMISVADPVGRQTIYHYDDPTDSTRLTSVTNTTQVQKCQPVQSPPGPFCQVACCGDLPNPCQLFASGPACGAACAPNPLPCTEDSNGGCVSYPACQPAQCCQPEPLADTLLTLVYGSAGIHEPTAVTYANGQTTNYKYNAVGQVTSVSDPLGNQTIYSYDGSGNQGNLLTISASLVSSSCGGGLGNSSSGATYQFTYAHAANGLLSNPNVASVTDFSGTVAFQYDSADRVTLETFSDGSKATFNYESISAAPHPTPFVSLDLTSATDRRGLTTQFAYDSERERTETVDPRGSTTTTYYYGNGLPSMILDPNGSAEIMSNPSPFDVLVRDLQGRVTTMTQPDLRFEEVAYDSAGRVFSRKRGQEPGATGTPGIVDVATYSYTKDDMVAGIDYSGSSNPAKSVSFTYDPAYPRIQQVGETTPSAFGPDTAGTTTYEYNPVGVLGANKVSRITEVLPGQSSIIQFGMAVGNLMAGVTYGYDELDRVVNRTVLDTGLEPGASESFSYDGLNRLVSNSNAVDSFTSCYKDVSPRPAIRVSPQGPQLTYAYHSENRDGLPEQTTFRDVAGHELGFFNYGYNADDRLTSVVTDWSGAANPMGLAEQSAAYGLGRANELTNAFIPGGQFPQNFNYGYDPNGNITSVSGTLERTVPAPTTSQNIDVASQYGPANVIVSAASYDSAGNTIQTEAPGIDGSALAQASYVWDSADRVVAAFVGDGESDFTYDGLGHLTEIVDKKGGTVVADHSYLWCGDDLCLRFDNTRPGAPADRHYFAEGWADTLVPSQDQTFANRTAFYYLRDQLGSVKGALSVQGSLTAQYEYDPYGQQRQVLQTEASDIGFAGYFHHVPSGLDFTLHRAYDPRFGRWLSRDPLGLAGGDINLYRYVLGDPVSLVDRSGEFVNVLVGAGIGAVAGGLGAYLTGGDVVAGIAAGTVTGGLAGLTGGLSLFGSAVAGVGSGLIGVEVSTGVQLLEPNGAPPNPTSLLTALVVGPLNSVLGKVLIGPLTEPGLSGAGAFATRRLSGAITSFALGAETKAACRQAGPEAGK